MKILTYEKIFLPAEAICSLVDIGLNPTKGICMDNINPTMKNELYAEKKQNEFSLNDFLRNMYYF